MRAALVSSFLLCACDGATNDPGLQAFLRIDGAQFQPGPMPAETAGPAVLGLQLNNARILPGELGLSLQGSVGETASALAIGLLNDVGYWTIPPGVPDPLTGVLTFKTSLSFAPLLPTGPHELVIRAVDSAGQFGVAATQTLEVLSPTPQGRLVVSLTWPNLVDLDLHVVDPAGNEIWARNINSYENLKPGTPSNPNAVMQGGVLDFDSNAQCIFDGRNRENVIWKEPPPSGSFQVRVDVPSLCEQSSSQFRVEVVFDGVSLGIAEGTVTSTHVDLFQHGRGAGLQVLSFSIP